MFGWVLRFQNILCHFRSIVQFFTAGMVENVLGHRIQVDDNNMSEHESPLYIGTLYIYLCTPNGKHFLFVEISNNIYPNITCQHFHTNHKHMVQNSYRIDGHQNVPHIHVSLIWYFKQGYGVLLKDKLWKQSTKNARVHVPFDV